MSFWSTSDGDDATTVGTSYEAPSGSIEPIPDDSTVLAMIGNAKWTKVKDGEAHYIDLEWVVLEPEAYKNRKIWHKLWVNDYDPRAKDDAAAKRKRDNARRMLAAVDANCGGKLNKIVLKGGDGYVPDDDDLAVALTNRPMVIKLKVWLNDEKKPGGNWVVSVAPKSAGIAVKEAAPTPATKKAVRDLEDDSIPF